MAQKKVIVDQRGQWKYPGKVTKIVGDTMATDGYGDIPLWVVPDVGEPRMIHPNTGDHTFPGASSFTEYPQMKQGGQMKKPSNKGFEHLPKYVQKHILANMKQEGGQASEDPVYLNRGGMFQMGGEHIPEHLLAGLVMGENLPIMQEGGFKASGTASLANRENIDQNLTRSDIKLNTNLGDIKPNANAEGINALYKYAQSKGISTAALNTNAGLKNIGLTTINEFNKANPNMQVTPEHISMLQEYHAKTDPRIKIDQLYGSETSRLYYPTPQQKLPVESNANQYGYLRAWASGSPGGNGYQSFNKPDLSGDWGNKQTSYHVDNATGQLIDPEKSYADGKYTPTFIPQTDPRWTNPKGTLFNQNSSIWDVNTNSAGFSKAVKPTAEELLQHEKQLEQSKQLPKSQFGGEPASKFMANYYKKYGGSQAPQGETLDEVLQNKNRDFTNYIANNTKAAIFKEEANHFQNGFAQFGQQVNSDKALMSGETDYLSSLPNSFTTPIPRDAPRAIPIGVRSAADQFGKMPAEKPFGGLDTRGTDPTFNYNNDGIDTGAIADIAMAGVQGLNSFFNNAQAVRQNNLNQDKLSIANNITPSYGSRGLYDINQGNFKPNQKTPYFQFGGTHGGELGSWDPKGENDRMTSIGKVDAAGFTRNPTSDNFAGTVPTFGKDGIGSKYYTRPEEKGPGLFSLGKAVGISSPMFKKGGQYEMDHKTILDLISKGYQIEFLD